MPNFESIQRASRSGHPGAVRPSVAPPAEGLPASFLRAQVVLQIDRTIRDLTALAQSSGLHQLIMDHADLPRLRSEIDRLRPEFLRPVFDRLSQMENEKAARRAFVIWQYMEYFLKAESGAIRISAIEDNQSQIAAIGRDADSGLVLCHNGLVLRSQSRNDKTLKKHIDDLRDAERQKKWLQPQHAVLPDERFSRFLDQLITQHDRDPREANSIYIRCSRKRAWEIANLNYGEEGIGRLWFSLVRRYSEEFVNSRRTFDAIAVEDRAAIERLQALGWVRLNTERGSYQADVVRSQAEWNDPVNSDLVRHWLDEMGNTVVMKIRLERNAYYDLLSLFEDKIRNRQIEGIDRISDWDFIAKIERGTPTFCIRNEELRKGLLRIENMRV